MGAGALCGEGFNFLFAGNVVTVRLTYCITMGLGTKVGSLLTDVTAASGAFIHVGGIIQAVCS